MAEHQGQHCGIRGKGMEELKMKAAGRELRFAFDLQAWFELEKIFGSMAEMNRRFEEQDRPLEAGLELAAITASAGARECGREPVTLEWLREKLTPKQAAKANGLAKAAFIAGMTREDEEEDEAAVDAVAEEIQKKTSESC